MGVTFYADEARQSSASTREILMTMKRLPESIRYGDGNSVTVINAFGNPMVFPLEIFFSWHVRTLFYTSSSVLTVKNRNSMIR
jgi:hypothetical protein